MEKWILTVEVRKDGHSYDIEEVLEGELEDAIDCFMYHHHEDLQDAGIESEDIQVEPFQE